MQHDRFHGRRDAQGRQCGWPGCDEPGEFRAPGIRSPGFDGPGDYRWFCLDHVRAFNGDYDYFAGMSSEEIIRAQSPIHGWERETRAFSPTAGIDAMPRWADFTDPLEAISARARARVRTTGLRKDGRAVTTDERRALDVLGLPIDADRRALRTRYSELVRRYHPDRNGGDRSFEARLQGVVEAYQLLRMAAAFG
ncbi:MAG: J domain-containing protein [Novosphingobium sp.]